MVDQCITASIGMNLLFEKKDYVIVDFGSDKIQMTIFADSLPVESTFLRMGMQKLIDLTKNGLYRNHQLDLTAKEIIELFESISMSDLHEKLHVKQKEIDLSMIEDILSHYFFLVNDELLACLERVKKHKNFGKIMLNGMYFTGGGSAIEFIRKKINMDSVLKFQVSKTPLLDNINGLGKLMADHAMYKAYISN